MSLADFALRHGVTWQDVTTAIKTGRLQRSVGENERGQPIIVDVTLADREWLQDISGPQKEPAGAAGLPLFSLADLSVTSVAGHVLLAFAMARADDNADWQLLPMTPETARQLALALEHWADQADRD
jgi:hypothetical protein